MDSVQHYRTGAADMSHSAWTVRTWHGPHDFPAMAAVGAAAAAADRLDDVVTADLMAATDHPTAHFESTRDILLAEAEGHVVALSRCEPVVEAAGRPAGEIRGQVDPAWRDRGIGTHLLRASELLLRDRLLAHTATPAHYVVWSDDTVSSARDLFEHEGYHPRRWSVTMLRSVDTAGFDAPMPAGLDLRPAAPEHYPTIWRALVEAFAEHWGRVPRDEDYATWLRLPNFDPALWQIAWDGDEVAGMVLAYIDAHENTTFGRARGYTETIAVRKPWRGRGLATALIRQSLDALQRRGMTEAALHVDIENTTHALRVYERCGYRVIRKSTEYRKLVT